MPLTGIIKKSGNHYVALCLEINISSQGDSIEEARRMLLEACDEYISYMKDEGLLNDIKPVSLIFFENFLSTTSNM